MTDKEQIIANLKKLKSFHNGSYGASINRAIKALEQELSNDMVSRGVFEQVMWERDVAIEQLKELGYELGEKICTTTTVGEGEVMYYPQVEGVTPTVVITEALEQEPFKPMVEIDLYSVIKQKYIEREILDKIRAEIEDLRFGQPLRKFVVDECLEIIDKYKESEYKDADSN